jgi:hypothetical protein
MKTPWIALLALTGACSAQSSAAADAANSTVVELYQSQGCSSCPPADAVLNGLADRSDVLALSFAVTYWDQLGWKDTFASPAFTQRQWDYAHASGRTYVATPQMVINGRGVVTGNDRAQVDDAIRRFARPAAGPEIVRDGAAVSIGESRGRRAIVWLVRFDPRTIAVPIRAGENGGRTIAHRNVVRQLVRLGEWTGARVRLAVPAATAGLSSAVLLQQGNGGAIVAARRL